MDHFSFGNTNHRTAVIGGICIVVCNSSIRLTGLIRGNVTAEQIEMEGGPIQGSIISEKHVSLDRDSWVNGEISAHTIMINGMVNPQAESSLISPFDHCFFDRNFEILVIFFLYTDCNIDFTRAIVTVCDRTRPVNLL